MAQVTAESIFEEMETPSESNRSGVGRWVREHPRREVVEEVLGGYVERKRSGRTTRSWEWLTRVLVDKFECPYSSPTAVMRYCEARWPAE